MQDFLFPELRKLVDTVAPDADINTALRHARIVLADGSLEIIEAIKAIRVTLGNCISLKDAVHFVQSHEACLRMSNKALHELSVDTPAARLVEGGVADTEEVSVLDPVHPDQPYNYRRFVLDARAHLLSRQRQIEERGEPPPVEADPSKGTIEN